MTRLPKVPPAAIAAAMRRFDEGHRGAEAWASWPTRADKNAVLFDRRHYPPKFIVHLATGAPLNSFSGGREVNTYLTNLGFEIVRLRPEEDLGPRYRNTYLVRAILLNDEGEEPIIAYWRDNVWVISDDPAATFAELDDAITTWERRGS